MIKNYFRFVFNAAIFLMISLHGSIGYSQQKWIPFNWEGETIEGRYFDKFLITVPVEIDSAKGEFKMQFDLGADRTLIYGNSIAAYINTNDYLKHKLDTSLRFFMDNKPYPMFRALRLKLGGFAIAPKNIGLFSGYGDTIPADSLFTKPRRLIGTIGADILKDKILILDYRNKRMALVDELPGKYAQAVFTNFTVSGGRIKLPLTINGEEIIALFDTGSSMFPLLTTEARAQAIATSVPVDSMKTSSWGDHYYVYGVQVKYAVKLKDKTLPPALIFYDKKHKFDDFYLRQQIWGLVGNVYFLNNVIIIDYKGKRFGIM